ncbi:phosphatidylethanolamine N-methyltransferase [Plenodomus lingam]|uniref:Phosphatidylethanolamine N-methyltransferase n=1 Tax=Leptosphaeria maculans (strain JN3 / isolate v23.1.3 / race Av1-4-5-6-7-8) TaxID=985895 RepID=E4ZQ61_LEPMJ|nr:similar to phosphatidylethanolamine N-methyltransferase [Plenodomus lingam JN3]KAH9874333.1 phosphatidylethanolamine N-methyltransferase [Plenodomus lingam]CBX89971.1 similar to phosphatidylethanolamine N-methyltransferase [Plenodomus lingam JN3]
MADMDSADGSQVRERPSAKPLHLHNSSDAKQKVLELNDRQGRGRKNNDKKRTYGRTPDGTVFIVPQTHDMVSQLLSPSQPKNLSDLAILAVLASLILTFFVLPKSARKPVFATVFLFWRAAYNGGIGWLLDGQSKHNRLVLWAKNSHVFEKPESGKNPHPAIYHFLKREMETKIPTDYKFDEAPIEYNTWLVFRRVVDLILMCDFVSYCLFALACFNRPQESGLLWALRWTTGVALFLFNLWVKLDAHRVVGDYAWYWGDFHFLIDQDLTFDGVFELAPHPMYSVGYAGYYGIALMMASYKVLAISIIAHAAQFAFLILVENVHIDKVYNPPAPRRTRHNSGQVAPDDFPKTGQSDGAVGDIAPAHDPVQQPAPMHRIVGPQNTDFHRLIDVTVALAYFYSFCFAVLTPNTWFVRTLFLINAFVWRLWHTLGLGYILDRQSKKKNWTRHFIKYGDSKEEAWRQWKYLCHLSMNMCYASFVSAAWKTYTLPPDWFSGLTLLRHVVGSALIALQIWVAFSIYDSLGEFGWFFGDFFYDPPSRNLTYSGIYRFLNNPERILGLAGVWGMALITWNAPMFYHAATAHMLNLLFLQFVEGPHMKKLYGQKLRETSGVSKTLRQALPSPVRHWQSAADVYVNSVIEIIERFLDDAKPRFAHRIDTLISDASALLKLPSPRIPVSLLPEDFVGLDPKQYKIEISGTLSPPTVEQEKNGGREGEQARTPAVRTSEFKTLVLEYGAPIRVRWQAPLNHSKKDWIGLYMVADNQAREVTRISSNGRWIATHPGVYDSTRAEDGILVSDKLEHASPSDEEANDYYTGEVEFRGDKLWWTTGVFEFRYHHGGKHHVMALSQAFETRIPRFDEDDVEVDGNGTVHHAVAQTLLPLVQNCFDRDPEIAPSTVDESFGSLVERDGKFAKRVVFAVHQMFGIEFAPEVVQADGNVRNLAWRICNAKKVLAPYSMSASRGRNTPTMR